MTTQKKTTTGRPPIADEPMVQRPISLTPDAWDVVAEIGERNYARGLRRIVKEHTGVGTSE